MSLTLSAPPAGQTYYFIVRAYNTGGDLSPASAEASGGVFTDRSLIVGTTVMKAAHVTELRSRINAVRLVRGLAAYSWAETVAALAVVRAQHMAEMRTALAAAFVAELLPPPDYTDAVLNAGMVVRAIHRSQLRAGVETLEGTP